MLYILIWVKFIHTDPFRSSSPSDVTRDPRGATPAERRIHNPLHIHRLPFLNDSQPIIHYVTRRFSLLNWTSRENSLTAAYAQPVIVRNGFGNEGNIF